MNIEQEIIDWIRDTVIDPPSELNAGSSLLASGLLDSLQLISLIDFAEAKFGVHLGEEDMHPDNFETVNAIARLTRKKNPEA
jgi:acyl carrier protein